MKREEDVMNKKFMRIGEVAKFCGVAKSTIRHYTDIGILPFEGKTPSGQRLYDPRRTMIRVQLIKSTSRPRATLAQVKERMKSEEGRVNPPLDLPLGKGEREE